MKGLALASKAAAREITESVLLAEVRLPAARLKQTHMTMFI